MKEFIGFCELLGLAVIFLCLASIIAFVITLIKDRISVHKWRKYRKSLPGLLHDNDLQIGIYPWQFERFLVTLSNDKDKFFQSNPCKWKELDKCIGEMLDEYFNEKEVSDD